MKDPMVADRLQPFRTTIFAEMTRLANERGAINLSQGFPDFDGPAFVMDAAAHAARDGRNQYAHPAGEPLLRHAVASWHERNGGGAVDPDNEVTVTAGCTEALAAALLGLVNPGEEVVLFQPYYDSYRACCAMAGAEPRFVTLRPPAEQGGAFWIDEAELRAAFTPRTKAVLVNTPHNPTGKVLTRDELGLIAQLCVEHDVIAITDEVYERLWFDESAPHVRLATLPGMRERTLTLSSLGKTFSYTGWKIGWAVGPARLQAGLRSAHQFLIFTVATPLQHGAAAALNDGEQSVVELVKHYREARDMLCEVLRDVGFGVYDPQGTYFVMVDHTPVSARHGLKDDVEFCKWLTGEIGVAAIPPSFFYADPAEGASLARFAFCKRMETLEAAAQRLRSLR